MRIAIANRRTTAEWAASPVPLRAGELGMNTSTGDVKCGDGESAWSALVAFGGVGGGGGVTIKDTGATVATGVTSLDMTGSVAIADQGGGEVQLDFTGGGGGMNAYAAKSLL